MKFAHFFIDRPVFAAVLSIVMVIVGAIAAFTLPIAQYPEIAPPTVVVSANYPGANAKTVADTVATPIEQQINGVENMLYMSSQCTNDGYDAADRHVQAGHEPGHRPGAGAEPRGDRPAAACRRRCSGTGITVKKTSPDITLVVQLYSPGQPVRPAVTSATTRTLQVRDETGALAGRGRHVPVRCARLLDAAVARSGASWRRADMTAGDVDQGGAGAERAGRGRRGRRAAAAAGDDAVSVHRQRAGPADRAASSSSDIIVKTGDDGRDHPRARRRRASSWAPPTTASTAYLNGKPAVAMPVFQLPGLQLDRDARRGLREDGGAARRRTWPAGLDYAIPYDTTMFVRDSIRDVVKTLFEAVVPGRAGRARVPAELAGDAGSAAGDAGFADRHVRGDEGGRVLAQQPVAVRPGAGDRHRGGRRDRGGRERRALDRARACRRARRPTGRWTK